VCATFARENASAVRDPLSALTGTKYDIPGFSQPAYEAPDYDEGIAEHRLSVDVLKGLNRDRLGACTPEAATR